VNVLGKQRNHQTNSCQVAAIKLPIRIYCMDSETWPPSYWSNGKR